MVHHQVSVWQVPCVPHHMLLAPLQHMKYLTIEMTHRYRKVELETKQLLYQDTCSFYGRACRVPPVSINVSSMLHFCTKFYLIRKLQSTFHLHTYLHQQRWYPSSCTLQQAQWISTRFGFILRNSQIRHATKCRWRFTSRSTIASAPDFWYCWKVIGIPTSACRKLLMTLQLNGHNWSAYTYFCSDTPLRFSRVCLVCISSFAGNEPLE